MSADTIKKALLIVDNQVVFRDKAYFGLARSNPIYEKNLTALLQAFRNSPLNPLVVHIQHHSLSLSSAFHASKPTAAMEAFIKPLAGEPIITKNVNSAFMGTNLEQLVRDHQVSKLYLAGATADHSVSTTTRMAANLHVTHRVREDGTVDEGEVVFIQDATFAHQKEEGSWDAGTVHGVSAPSLLEFATVVDIASVLEELAADDK